MKKTFWLPTAAAVCSLIVASSPTLAATIDVAPGMGTLQAAIDAANPHDKLEVHAGDYVGAVIVNKPLTIFRKEQGPGQTHIDAACGAPVAFEIASDFVKLTGHRFSFITVKGGTTEQIRIAGRNGISLKYLVPATTTPCGTEQHDVEISGASSVKMQNLIGGTSGIPSAILLDGIPSGSKISFKLVDFSHADTNLLIQNSGSGAPLGKSGIRAKNSFFGNAKPGGFGIQLVNSDGFYLSSSGVGLAVPGTGDSNVTGISLDSQSDNNRFVSVTWADFSGGTGNVPYVDAGTGNCGKNNGFAVPACN